MSDNVLPPIRELFPNLFNRPAAHVRQRRVSDNSSSEQLDAKHFYLPNPSSLIPQADPLNLSRSAQAHTLVRRHSEASSMDNIPPSILADTYTISSPPQRRISDAGVSFCDKPQHSYTPLEYEDTLPYPGRKRYVCDVCEKRFERPSSLTTHMNSHTGNRPHHCQYPGCSKAFTTRSNMLRHFRSHYDHPAIAMWDGAQIAYDPERPEHLHYSPSSSY